MRTLQRALLTALVAAMAAGCAGRSGPAAWLPFGPGTTAPAGDDSIAAPQAAASHRQTPHRSAATEVRRASAAEPVSQPADEAEAGRVDDVIYCDPMLPRGHVLR